MSTLLPGSDGELVREVGAWSEEKLFYVERYVDIFTEGMKNRWPRRVYIDLFSGPGKCVIEGTSREIPGSPLIALKYGFTDALLNDKDPRATASLKRRTAEFPAIKSLVTTEDCNTAARMAPSALQLDQPGTLALAVVDPTAFQISLASLEELTRGRRVDLIVTLMTGYLKRFLAEPAFPKDLDSFFGGPDWQGLVDLRRSGGKITFGALLDLYASKLRAIGYAYVDHDINLLNSNEQTIYHLVFASKNDRGLDFFRKISGRRFSGQQKLL